MVWQILLAYLSVSKLQVPGGLSGRQFIALRTAQFVHSAFNAPTAFAFHFEPLQHIYG